MILPCWKTFYQLIQLEKFLRGPSPLNSKLRSEGRVIVKATDLSSTFENSLAVLNLTGCSRAPATCQRDPLILPVPGSTVFTANTLACSTGWITAKVDVSSSSGRKSSSITDRFTTHLLMSGGATGMALWARIAWMMMINYKL